MNKRIKKKHMSIDYLCRKTKGVYTLNNVKPKGLFDTFPVNHVYFSKPDSIYNGKAQMEHGIAFLMNKKLH